MALHYIFGSSGAGKSHWLCKKMLRQAKSEPQRKILVVVPEQFTLQTQKDFVTLDPDQPGIMNIDVLSFLRLAYRVFEETGGGDRLVLEDTGKSMIVKKIAAQSLGQLQYFGRNVNKYGFIEEIKSVLSEFYQYGIGTEEMEEMFAAAGENPVLKKKLADLQLLYTGFQDFLADRYITTEGILDLLRELVPGSRLLKDSIICFDGFTGFTPSQYKLMEALMRQAAECYVTLTLPPELVFHKLMEQDLFYLTSHTVEWLDRLAAESGQEIAEPEILQGRGRYQAAESLQFLEQNLFQNGTAAYQGETGNIGIFVHNTLSEEIVWVVAEIYQLVKSGYRYRDIAVICTDLESCAPGLAREFERAGLPCFIDRKTHITGNPVVEFLLALLELVSSDFSYEAVLQYMKSPLSGFSQEEQDILENYVLAVGIRRYSGYTKPWSRRYRTAYTLELDKLNEIRVRLIERTEHFYQSMKTDKASGLERVTAVYEVLAEHGAEFYLTEMAEQLKEKEPLRASEYEQVWQLLLDLFDRIAGLLGEDIMTRKEFAEILQTGIMEAKVGLVPPGIDQIVAGDMERTRLKDIRVLFFIGVNEGLVPKPARGGGILSERDRELFAAQGIELAPTRRQTTFLSEFYLYLNLTKPSEKLYLTYRKTDTAGKSMRPSYLIQRILRLYPDIRVQERQQERLVDCLGTDCGWEYFLAGIQEYLKLPEMRRPYFYELYQLYLDQELEAPMTMEGVASAAFYQRQEQPLSVETAHRLYGEVLGGSVTRLEKFAACAYAHFLSYGLQLEERVEYQISIPDIGTLYHNALQLYAEKLREGQLLWHTITETESSRLITEAVRETADQYGNGILQSSKRNEYLQVRMERMLKRTVEVVTSQIRAGDFEPAAFEHAFVHADRYLSLAGRIDRIDLCQTEGKNYLRVVDYKSGNTSFDLEKLYYGLQLQLAVYMEAAETWAKEQGLSDVVPAGMFYYHIDNPIVEKGGDTEQKIRRKLAMDGLVNDRTDAIIRMDHAFLDQAGGLAAGVTSEVIPVATNRNGARSSRSMTAEEKDFRQIMLCAGERLYQNAEEVLQGAVLPAPYRKGQENACAYCAMKQACNFDRHLQGYFYRDLKKLEAKELWSKIREGGADQDGNEVDGGTKKGN